MKLKPRTAHDLIVLEYISRKNLVMEKALLLTFFKENRTIQSEHSLHLMAAELVYVYAVLKPADGKKDEVEEKFSSN